MTFSQAQLSNFRRLHAFGGGGFTMVEIVIMLGIITMVSLVVLVNFPAVNETIFIQRSGQEVTGLLRRAQSMSLAVRSVRDPSTGLVRIPRGVGIRFLNDSSSMILFGELCDQPVPSEPCDPPPNWFYDEGKDAIIATYALERNLKTMLSTKNRLSIGQLNVVFASPDASLYFRGESDIEDLVNESPVSIKILTPQLDLQRSVEVSITGQISVK